MLKKASSRSLLPLLAVALLVAAGQAGAVTVNLCAGPVAKTMPDATVVPMWGFALDTGGVCAAQVPGPTLAVPVGDTTVDIFLRNTLTVPVSIMIPGQVQATTAVRIPEGDPSYPSPAGTGGRIRSFTAETAPGTTQLYSWTGFRPGTYLYKSGTHQQVQVPMGLYGAITQDFAAGPPAQAYDGVTYDNQVVVVYSAVDPVLNAAVVTPGAYGAGGTVMTSTLDSSPRYFLVNGQPFSTAAPIQYPAGPVGLTTLLRLVNASTATMVPTFYGEDVRVVAEHGHAYPFPLTQHSVDLAAGMTRDALFTPTRGGLYPVVDRTLHLTNAAAPDGGWIFKLAVAGDPNRPVATTDAYATTEDVASFSSPVSVLANDVAGLGGPITAATLVQDVLHGTLALLADGTFTYTPDADYSGADFFLYTARDGVPNASEPVAAVIRIDPVNDPPVAVADDLTTAEDLPLVLPAPGVLGNDVDVDGDALSALLVSLPANGSVSLLASGALTYTPNPNWSGVDGFQYEARDAVASGGVATVTVAVAPVNDVPLAVTDVLPVALLDTPLVVAAPGVLVNDSDPLDTPPGPLTAVLVDAPFRGGVVLNPDGSLTYTPDQGFVGVDWFRYKVSDGELNSLAVKAYVLVSPVFYNGFENGDFGDWTVVTP